MTGQTNLHINLNINNVPQGYYTQNLVDNSRHVVLNLDPTVIVPKGNTGKSLKTSLLGTVENFEVLDQCQQLFVSKSGEPWSQLYVVKTRWNERIFIGKSDNDFPPHPTSSPSIIEQEECVYVTNVKGKKLMRITVDPKDFTPGSQELNFIVRRAMSGTVRDITLGEVRLFNLNGFHFVTGIRNEVENVQFATRTKNGSIQIIQDGQSVAIVDFRRTSLINWIESYMLTFTKELSFNSKAILMAACMCYDIGFCQRSDARKTISVYIFSLFSLFSAAALLYNFL